MGREDPGFRVDGKRRRPVVARGDGDTPLGVGGVKVRGGRDVFDSPPRRGRVGAHRVQPRPRYVWQYVVAGFLGFALFTSVGIFYVMNVGKGEQLSIITGEKPVVKKKQVRAHIDPDARVAIINGNRRDNLAESVQLQIVRNKWGDVVFTGDSESRDVEISAVFYKAVGLEPAARALASKLGGASSYQTEKYGEFDAQLIVLLGSDYRGPGLREAQGAG